MRKLRRKQKLEAATFTARLGYHEMINSNSSKHLVHTQKVNLTTTMIHCMGANSPVACTVDMHAYKNGIAKVYKILS